MWSTTGEHIGWRSIDDVVSRLASDPLYLNAPHATVARHMKDETDAYKAGSGFRTRPNPMQWFLDAAQIRGAVPGADLTEEELRHGGFADSNDPSSKIPSLSSKGRPLKLPEQFLTLTAERTMKFKGDVQFGVATVQAMASKTYAELFPGGVCVCVCLFLHNCLLTGILSYCAGYLSPQTRGSRVQGGRMHS